MNLWQVSTEDPDDPAQLVHHDVRGWEVSTEGGALTFTDEGGALMQAWGPGHWVHVRWLGRGA